MPTLLPSKRMAYPFLNERFLYIRFIETTVTTKHLAEGIAADYDAEGRLAGIEILDAVKRFGAPEVFRQVVLEDIALVAQ